MFLSSKRRNFSDESLYYRNQIYCTSRQVFPSACKHTVPTSSNSPGSLHMKILRKMKESVNYSSYLLTNCTISATFYYRLNFFFYLKRVGLVKSLLINVRPQRTHTKRVHQVNYQFSEPC